jgi:hypothetical protein
MKYFTVLCICDQQYLEMLKYNPLPCILNTKINNYNGSLRNSKNIYDKKIRYFS